MYVGRKEFKLILRTNIKGIVFGSEYIINFLKTTEYHQLKLILAELTSLRVVPLKNA